MDLSSIKIKRYRTAKTIKLRILEDGSLVVTTHTFTTEKQVKKFIESQREWIEDKLLPIHKKRKYLTTERSNLLFRGKEYDFRLSVQKNKRPKTSLLDKTITVTVKNEEHTETRVVLQKWYKKEAKKYFVERVPLLADLVDKNVKNVTIRSQRSRWGSCSSRSTISLNWKLIQTPDWISDYVIYHELAHLTHMNHSKAFWNLVNNYFPEYKNAEKWLKDNHSLLSF